LSVYNGPDERHIEGYIPDAATQATADRAEESAE
jgi:citrate synthase